MKKTKEQKKKKKKTFAEKYWNEKVICIAGVLYTPAEMAERVTKELWK